MTYNRINNIVGWVAFGIALVVYLLTMSPTASFWDCGEFIACANELEVPHPPGAPFFLLLGRIFAIFSFGDVTLTPWMLNFMSVLSSAFTVLFTFWITTIFAKKLLIGDSKSEKELSFTDTIAIMGAGLVGALACTFADSFWFNAVEAEVYALSSFFTAIVVWLMLKWESRADQPGNERWIILIAYLMGLSIGVHLLNLLTVPALAYIYYFRKYEFSWMGFLATGAVAVAILGFIQAGIIQWTFDLAWQFEKFFTGTVTETGATSTGMGLPFGVGAIVFFLLLFGGLGFAVYYTHKNRMLTLNTLALGVVVVFIGFGSYLMIPIRSQANPPIDENNPEDALTFLSYMKREQYGNRPLLYGPLYNVQPNGFDRVPEYAVTEGKDRYTIIGEKATPVYPGNQQKIFPRMYEPGRYNMGPHAYTAYVKNTGQPNTPYDDQPTAGEDLKFFFGYQINHMYWRYFFWNFVGRESDVQDCGWESGWSYLIGQNRDAPEFIKDNRGKNHYYAIPLLIGILGLAFQVRRRGYDATIVGMLFFFTGLAIIIYLNQYPMQPRERDYSFAGSFQTFAIWIGLGVMALYDFLKKYLKDAAAYASVGLALLAPVLMAADGWDDHSRAGRYLAPDSAYNLLNSLAQDAVLFTNGDNDTFPLWYLQEVEGVRPDVRVLCLSYVNTDWYINQMRQQMNESPPLPLTLNQSDYLGQENQVTYLRDAKTTLAVNLPADRTELVNQGIISPEEASRISGSAVQWQVPTRSAGNRRYLELKDVLILNLIQNVAKNGWDRPVYFANTVAPNSLIGLRDYLRLEGLAFRVVPVKYPSERDPYYPYTGKSDVGRMYENLIQTFRYRNLANPDVYYDENSVRMVTNYHSVFYGLANDLYRKSQRAGNTPADSSLSVGASEMPSLDANTYLERAREVMTFLDENIHYEAVEVEPYVIIRNGIMFDRLGMQDEAQEYFDYGYRKALETLNFYAQTGDYFASWQSYLSGLSMLYQHYREVGKMQEAGEIAQHLQRFQGMR